MTALVIVIALLVALGLTYAGRAWLACEVATSFLLFAFTLGSRA